MEAVVEEESKYEQSAMSVHSPRDINSLANSKRELAAEVFEFNEINVQLSDMDSSEESWEILSPILDLSNNRLTNSLNEDSEGRTENSDAYNFFSKQAHSSERGYKSKSLYKSEKDVTRKSLEL
jgi:hypothetical protein